MGRVNTGSLVENPAEIAIKFKNEKTQKNPVTRKIEVIQESGFYYWDKSLNDGKGGDVKVELPLTFTWLETAISIMGFHPTKEKGIYSNEILSQDLKTSKLHVKCDGEVLESGVYGAIKEKIKGFGGKFSSIVYALADINGEEKLVRFLFPGSLNSAWIDFHNNAKSNSNAISVSELKLVEGKTGNSWEIPVFKYIPLTESEKAKADATYLEKIEPFFNSIKNQQAIQEEMHVEVEEDYGS